MQGHFCPFVTSPRESRRLAVTLHPPETTNSVPEKRCTMLSVEPLFVLVLTGLLGLLFFGFLLVRRTLVGLREGYDDGRRK